MLALEEDIKTTAHIKINFSQSQGILPTYQHGFSQGGESQMPVDGYFETAMNTISNLSPRYIRIDHIYDYYHVYQLQPDGTIIYNWTEIDRIVDTIFTTGAEPLISLSYMPVELGKQGVYGPPSNYETWENLVHETVYHFNIERGLNIQYWEVWNEPNLPKFWNGTLDEYLKLYRATAEGALRADSSIKIGGASTASKQFTWSSSQITENNWVSALVDYVEEHDLPLDFLSWHLYDKEPENYRSNIERHQSWVKNIDPRPALFLTEWNWQGRTDPAHDNGETISYTAAVLATLIDTPLDQAYFFEPIDGALEFEGFWGLLRAGSTPKPIFYAFQLLNRLNGQYFAVDSNHPQVGAIATQNNDKITIAVWNNHSGHTVTTSLILSEFPAILVVEAQIYGIDSAMYNASSDKQNVDLFINEEILIKKNNVEEWQLNITVPDNGLRLIEIQLTP